MKVKINTNPKNNPIKDKAGKILCVIQRQSRKAILSWQNSKNDRFSVGGHTYFIDPNGCYVDDRGFIVAVYLEGASLPVHHGCLEYETLKARTIQKPDPFTGEMVDFNIPERTIIKTVKYDSGLIDLLLGRNLADVFTRVHLDLPNLVLTILLFGTLITSIIGVVMTYLMNG